MDANNPLQALASMENPISCGGGVNCWTQRSGMGTSETWGCSTDKSRANWLAVVESLLDMPRRRGLVRMASDQIIVGNICFVLKGN